MLANIKLPKLPMWKEWIWKSFKIKKNQINVCNDNDKSVATLWTHTCHVNHITSNHINIHITHDIRMILKRECEMGSNGNPKGENVQMWVKLEDQRM